MITATPAKLENITRYGLVFRREPQGAGSVRFLPFASENDIVCPRCGGQTNCVTPSGNLTKDHQERLKAFAGLPYLSVSANKYEVYSGSYGSGFSGYSFDRTYAWAERVGLALFAAYIKAVVLNEEAS